MKLKFKFPNSRIRTFSQQLQTEISKYLEFSRSYQQSSPKIDPDQFNLLSLLPESAELLKQAGHYLHDQRHLDFQLLPASEMGDNLSATRPLENLIVLHQDQFMEMQPSSNPWLPVVLAHELGHWFLHAPAFRRFGGQLDLFDKCQIGSTLTEISALDNDAIDLLDQQANCFAREWLLPEERLRTELQQAGYYPPIIYRQHHLSLMSFADYSLKLAEKIERALGLPVTYLSFRLQELGLLLNHAQSQPLKHTA